MPKGYRYNGPEIIKQCEHCGKKFKPKNQAEAARRKDKYKFCCKSCFYDHIKVTPKHTHCLQCGKKLRDDRRADAAFCNQQCASLYFHAHRDKSKPWGFAKTEKESNTITIEPCWESRDELGYSRTASFANGF